jgi:hypothetical protein
MGSHSTMRLVLYVGLDLQIVTCLVVLQKGFIAMVLVMEYLEQSCIRASLNQKIQDVFISSRIRRNLWMPMNPVFKKHKRPDLHFWQWLNLLVRC